MVFFATSIAAVISGAAGVSSPSTIRRVMRSGCEAFKQYSNLVQNGADKIISSTRLPSVDKDRGLLCHSSLTTKALKPFLFLYILAKVR